MISGEVAMLQLMRDVNEGVYQGGGGDNCDHGSSERPLRVNEASQELSWEVNNNQT